MRIAPTIAFVAMLLVAVGQTAGAAPLDGDGGQQQAGGPLVTSTRQHAFKIPFRIEPARTSQEEPIEVQLHVSSNQGGTWEVSDRVKPDKGSFVFRAPHDGEYWYAIRTVDRQGVTRPEGQLQAQLKVVVDTVAPRLEVSASCGEAGEIVAHWQAVDPHLKPTSFKLEYQADAAGPWERVAVEAPPSAMRHTVSGEATWWPRAANGTITVRAEITDASGNPAMTQAIVKLGDNPKPGDNSFNNSLGSNGTAGGQGESTRWPADRATTEPLGQQTGAERRTAERMGDRAGSTADPRGARPNDPRNATTPRVAAQPVAQYRRNPDAASPLDFTLLPTGQRPRMVNSRTFELEYEIESVGPSGIGRVELWGTLDGGRTWTLFGVDADNQSPVPVRVEKEGIFGFRIVVRSGNGLGAPPPVEGEAADVWIGVDLLKPTGRITAAEPSDDGTELVITWEASDDALDVRPIGLAFSDSTRAQWTPIAAGLENSGSYTWRFDGRVPPLVYLRLEVRDEAGNVTTTDFPDPVSLDRAKPAGRIRGVRPVQ